MENKVGVLGAIADKHGEIVRASSSGSSERCKGALENFMTEFCLARFTQSGTKAEEMCTKLSAKPFEVECDVALLMRSGLNPADMERCTKIKNDLQQVYNHMIIMCKPVNHFMEYLFIFRKNFKNKLKIGMKQLQT